MHFFNGPHFRGVLSDAEPKPSRVQRYTVLLPALRRHIGSATMPSNVSRILFDEDEAHLDVFPIQSTSLVETSV